jgi:copper transport protein
MPRLSRTIGSSFVTLWLCLGWPALAAAHAVLLGSSPEPKASVDAAPSEIVLEFNENVGPVFLKVLDHTGQEVGGPGEIVLDGNKLRLPLSTPLDDGTYIVTYRVISADTHPVGGSFLFAVGGPVAALDPASMAAPAKSGWWVAVAANRFVHYAAVLLALGSALVLLWLRVPAPADDATFRQGYLASLVAIAAYLLAIAFGGAEMVSGGAAAFLSPKAWAMGVKSTLLPSAVLGVPGAALLAWAFRQHRLGGPLWAGGALVLLSFLVTGHAATAPPVWLMATNVALHLVCGAFWFAALLPLTVAVRRLDGPASGALLVQFSTRAAWTVALLFVSGLIVSIVQVRSWDQLFGTDYGLRLALKIGLFLVLLALAAANKVAFTPAVVRGDASGVRRLRGSMRVEYGLMLAIVLAAASLTVVTPPRALLAQGAGAAQGAAMGAVGGEGVRASATAGGYTVDVEVTPGRTGENMIMLTWKDAGGKPVAMQSSRVTLSLPSASIEGVQVDGDPMDGGMWHLMTDAMIVPGEWQMRIEAFVDDFDKVVAEVPVNVK